MPRLARYSGERLARSLAFAATVETIKPPKFTRCARCANVDRERFIAVDTRSRPVDRRSLRQYVIGWRCLECQHVTRFFREK